MVWHSGCGRSVVAWVFGVAMMLGGTALSHGEDRATIEVSKDGTTAKVGRCEDAALDRLNDLPNLKSLVIQSDLITDAGLARLKGLKGLTYLSVDINPKVTDTGLKLLNHLPNLTGLYLGNLPKVTSKGLENLTGLSKLETLSLTRLESVDDGAAKTIASLTTLKSIQLQNIPFTDKGLDVLRTLKLHTFYMYGASRTTPEGRFAFREALEKVGCKFDKGFGQKPKK